MTWDIHSIGIAIGDRLSNHVEVSNPAPGRFGHTNETALPDSATNLQ